MASASEGASPCPHAPHISSRSPSSSKTSAECWTGDFAFAADAAAFWPFDSFVPGFALFFLPFVPEEGALEAAEDATATGAAKTEEGALEAAEDATATGAAKTEEGALEAADDITVQDSTCPVEGVINLNFSLSAPCCNV